MAALEPGTRQLVAAGERAAELLAACLPLKSINVISPLEPGAARAAETLGHRSDQSRISITVIKGDTDKKPLLYETTAAVRWLQPARSDSGSIKITGVALG